MNRHGQALAYTQEQSTVIQQLTQGAGLSLLHGQAGTGKTTVLSAVAHAYHRAGYRVVRHGGIGGGLTAISPGHRDCEAKTIHLWMLEWDIYANHRQVLATEVPDDATFESMQQALERVQSSQLSSNNIILVDEASMVGTQQMTVILRPSKSRWCIRFSELIN